MCKRTYNEEKECDYDSNDAIIKANYFSLCSVHLVKVDNMEYYQNDFPEIQIILSHDIKLIEFDIAIAQNQNNNQHSASSTQSGNDSESEINAKTILKRKSIAHNCMNRRISCILLDLEYGGEHCRRIHIA